jgi:predicted GNAT family acetyltransferase
MSLQELTNTHAAEALTFLAARPLHTVMMAGFINDNGVVNPLNRGVFYACRNAQRQLEGIALIGHVTLFEARTDAALEAFAQLARSCPYIVMLAGEQEKLEQFWQHYAAQGQSPRQLTTEYLYVQREFVEMSPGGNVRQAKLDDVELLIPLHATMVREASGINPMEKDPLGFRLRLVRRIEQGRVLVWIEEKELLFTASVISDTPMANYLEGVYVNPAHRGKGHGLRCMSQVSQKLLARTRAVCGFVNERNRVAQAFYLKAGYELDSYYKKIYV